MRLVLLVVLLAAFGCAGCEFRTTQPPDSLEQTGQQRSPEEVPRVPVTTVPPRTPAQSGPSVVTPLAPVNSAQPSDDPANFASPSAVGVEWMRQWCTADWREPMNANLTRASRYQTSASAKKDGKKGDNENTYRVAQEQRLSSGCDGITATPSPEAPQSADVAYLVLAARRVNSAAGAAFESEQVQSVRRVLRQADGRWFVDEQLEVG